MTKTKTKSYAGMGLTRKQIASRKKIDMWNAQELTIEEQFDKGLRFINRMTISQRDAYYESVVEWESGRFDRQIKEAEERLKTASNTWDKKMLIGNIEEFKRRKENLPLYIKTLQWLEYAKQDFDRKLEKVAQKLVDFGFCKHKANMKVIDLSSNHNRGLDFYIECEEYSYSQTEKEFGSPKKVYESKGRAHARLVWVHCYDKASHWRFICTKKAK